MLFVVLYLGFFVVSLPAAVIATLKGRWWIGVLGYLGFVGTILGFRVPSSAFLALGRGLDRWSYAPDRGCRYSSTVWVTVGSPSWHEGQVRT